MAIQKQPNLNAAYKLFQTSKLVKTEILLLNMKCCFCEKLREKNVEKRNKKLAKICT